MTVVFTFPDVSLCVSVIEGDFAGNYLEELLSAACEGHVSAFNYRIYQRGHEQKFAPYDQQ